MRYENWDLILFPRDSHVPLQEFKTACYVTRNGHHYRLPTLCCYIASLPAGTPFRISLHSWAPNAKPSAVIESRKRPQQRVVYTIQVVVDGIRLYHGFYESSTTWPQEIEHEKRTISHAERNSSRKRVPLEFPPFNQHILMQSSWDARDSRGRVQVFLAEQLLSEKTGTPDEVNFGESNDIVCFAFEHAPRDVLEQAGISWPIRNPLYQPTFVADARSISSHAPPGPFQARARVSEHQPLSSYGRLPGGSTIPAGPHLDSLSQPLSAHHSHSGRESWGNPMHSPCEVSNDVSMTGSWSTERTVSHAASSNSMPDVVQPRAVGDSQVVMTLRDDQFSALLRAVSPPKAKATVSGLHNRSSAHSQLSRASGTGPPLSTKPSPASLARTASYSVLPTPLRIISDQAYPVRKEDRQDRSDAPAAASFYHPSSESRKENRVPTPFPFESRIPAPYLFTHGPSLNPPVARFAVGGPSGEVRGPSFHSSRSHVDFLQAPIPTALPRRSGDIKSKKEGQVHEDVRPNKSPLPDGPESQQDPQDAPHGASSNADVEALLDAGFDESAPFVPGHRSGTDSLDRIQQQLYRALGDASSFDATIDSGTLPDLDLDSPIMKRKRQGTIGGERGKSPAAKTMREESNCVPGDGKGGFSNERFDASK